VSDTIDKDGFPLGGNALVIFNGELRLPPWRNASLHGFVDTGNVFARVSQIDLALVRTAVGLGVFYKSPVGPLRFDVGFKVNPLPTESPTAWFLTFGHAF
jgi:outer membrane protein insertion porin family